MTRSSGMAAGKQTRLFRCGPATITLDDQGSVVRVSHDRDPDETWLVGGGVPEVVVAAQPLDWTFEELVIDLDEVEIERSCWPLSATVRHVFAERWGVQLTLQNLSDRSVAIDSCSLSWRSDPRRAAWALAAGAAGAYALSPLDAASLDTSDGRGLIFGGVLAGGTCDDIDADALRSDPITMAPGGLQVLRWNWDWFESPADFTATRHRDVPWTFYRQTGELIRITSDADTAIVITGDGLAEVERSAEEVDLEACGEGRSVVELSSARGTTRYSIQVPKRQAMLVSRAADDALRGPSTAAGVVKLADVHAALAVQQALLGGDVDDRVGAEDALELFLARRLENLPTDPLLTSFAATEAERTGEPDLLRAAIGWWAGPSGFIPGLGLALGPLYLAALTQGLAAPQLPRWWGRVESPIGAQSHPIAWAAELEHLMIAGSHPPGTDQTSRRLQAASAVGSWLGAGFKGTAVRPLPVADVAYLATVLRLCGEDLSGQLTTRWGYGPTEVVERAQAEVRWRIADLPAGAALSWLILADRVQ